VARWDRTIGAPRPSTTPTHEEDHHTGHPTSGKKGKKDRHKHEPIVEKESPKEKEVSAETDI